jgi:hypothetical protein
MKIIDTSAVNANSWLPLLGNYGGSGANAFATTSGTGSMAGIDFIQQAYTECLNAISQFAIADTTKVTVMYGCNQFYTPPSFSTFDTYYEPIYFSSSPNSYGINPGWIYYQGELYYVAGMSYTTITTGQHVNATISTAYSTADSAVFSDSASHNIHAIRTISFSISTTAHSTGSGTTLPDYNYWTFPATNSNAQTPVSTVINNWITNTWITFTSIYTSLTTPPITVVGTTGNPQFENGWLGSGLTGSSNPLSYYKVFNRVYLWGEIHLPTSPTGPNSSTIFHLPGGYHPLSREELFAVPDLTAANYSTGGANPGYTWYIWVQRDGSVTFLGNAITTGPKISLSGINFLTGVYKAPVEVLAPVTDLTESSF